VGGTRPKRDVQVGEIQKSLQQILGRERGPGGI